MSDKGKSSRRRFIVSGAMGMLAATMRAAASPTAPDQSSVSNSNHGLSAPGRAVSIVRPSESAFENYLDTQFPQLRQDPQFQSIAPLAFLMVHTSGPPIHAHSTTWDISTAAGTFKKTFFFYSQPGPQLLISGSRKLLASGEMRLVSPFFNWTPDTFRQKAPVDWEKIWSRGELQLFLKQQANDISNVAVRLDAVIYSDFVMIGPDDWNLANHFRARRNGEHDEAHSLLGLTRLDSPADRIRAQLTRDQTIQGAAAGRAISRSQVFVVKYWRARTRQAAALKSLFEQTSYDDFTATLVRLKSQPKTRVRAIPSYQMEEQS